MGRHLKILTLSSCVLAFALCVSAMPGSSFGADNKQALAAYKKGDYATALTNWKTLAEQGDAEALFRIGMMYGNGHGVTKDKKLAHDWIIKAAERGHPEAQNSIGVMYATGQLGKPDYMEAYKWLHLSAVRGFKKADRSLAYVKRQLAENQLYVAKQRALDWRPCPLAKPCPE